ncbi:MAG: thioredoxin domain-containing protein [Pseudomonadota bacterium]
MLRLCVSIKKNTLSVCCLMALAFGIAFAPQAKAAPNADMMEAVRTVLRENPELIFEALRQDPELVLEIAQEGGKLQQRKNLLAAWQVDVDVPKSINMEGRPVRGKADAPVTIVAYSDFSCPFCKRASGTMEKLLEKYDGQVNYVFKNAPMESHVNAILASQYYVAAALQGSEKAWEYYDTIFETNDRLGPDGEVYLLAIAQELGFDIEKLENDAYSSQVAEKILEDQREAVEIGLSGTPCFLVNDIIVRGALDESLFDEAIRIALEKKGLAPKVK